VIDLIVLFALGFLTAVLLAIMLAPLIHNRIVVLTERRMRATTPLSASEVRAQTDMARAEFAAEKARISIELKQMREQLTLALGQADRFSRAIQDEKQKFDAQTRVLQETLQQADILSASLEDEKVRAASLSDDILKFAALEAEKTRQIHDLTIRLSRMQADNEGLKIDLAASSAEHESLRAQIGMLRDEKRRLGDQLKEAMAKAREAQNRIDREQERIRKLDQKLAEAVAHFSDMEIALERKSDELALARAQLGQHQTTMAGADPGEPVAAMNAKIPRADWQAPLDDIDTIHHYEGAQARQDEPAPALQADETDAVAALSNRHAALIKRLADADKADNDDAIRAELADIAARMVALIAAREGEGSPIPDLVNMTPDHAEKDDGTVRGPAPSLAARTRDYLAQQSGPSLA